MYKTIDLFAGAGGLSLGFKQTGKFNIIAAAENNIAANETYLLNIPDDPKRFEVIGDVVGYDFTALNERVGGIDIVIGGPPCQGFSNANRQKNHLISMNNALVKEYFRAIKEINPIAFVMENVSMLESDTHRFYDSYKDHDVITTLNIPMRKDSLIICDQKIEGFELAIIAKNSKKVKELTIPSEIYQLLSVLNKNKSNQRKLSIYLEKNIKKIKKKINQYCENSVDIGETKIITQWLYTIIKELDNNNDMAKSKALNDIIELQKALKAINEIYENELIGIFIETENKGLKFIVNSYAVIDYINAILNNLYIQQGTTLNAEAFGVPQERKRHIIIGIRKDKLNGKELDRIEVTRDKTPVTVGEAINDLVSYMAGEEKTYEPILYNNDSNISEYAKAMRHGSKTVKNHFCTRTTKNALDRFKMIPQGKNFHWLPVELKSTYAKPERTQNTIYLRLDPNKPCGTVVNVRKSMWIHPFLDRALTVREAARLQSFPDSFEFIGSKDSQFQQVGNAVPPLLANAIATYILKIIAK